MPQNIVRFKNNLDVNNLNDKVTLFEIGLSSGPDRAFLEDRLDNSGASFVSMTPTETEINLDCLDNIYKKLGRPQIDFMKIDIEGHELSFLEGAQIALIEAKPFLLVEIDPPKLRRSGENPKSLADKLKYLGYELYFIRKGKLTLLKELPYGEDYINVFCFQREKHLGSDKFRSILNL